MAQDSKIEWTHHTANLWHGCTEGQIDWIIVGGESGHHKRPFNTDWARDIREFCSLAHIPFFFKQIDKIQAIPEDLMIRQFPKL